MFVGRDVWPQRVRVSPTQARTPRDDKDDDADKVIRPSRRCRCGRRLRAVALIAVVVGAFVLAQLTDADGAHHHLNGLFSSSAATLATRGAAPTSLCVHVFIVAHNEHVLLPLALAHYTTRFPGCACTVLDKNSTDDTPALAIAAGCNVRPFFTGEQQSDPVLRRLKNTAWQTTTMPTWVIMADVDEWLDATLDDLQREDAAGTTILTTVGASVVMNSAFADLHDIDMRHATAATTGASPSPLRGYLERRMSKRVCFKYALEGVHQINFGFGAHDAKPTSTRVQLSRTCYALLHMTSLGLPYFAAKQRVRVERLAVQRARGGPGRHYSDNDRTTVLLYAAAVAAAEPLTPGLGTFTCTDDDSREKWWSLSHRAQKIPPEAAPLSGAVQGATAYGTVCASAEAAGIDVRSCDAFVEELRSARLAGDSSLLQVPEKEDSRSKRSRLQVPEKEQDGGRRSPPVEEEVNAAAIPSYEAAVLAARNKGSDRVVLLCSNARDELNVLEWIVHHKLLGFSHVLLVDHLSLMPLAPIIHAAGLSKFVTVVRSEENVRKKQRIANAHAYAVAHGFEWMLYIDMDEFVVLSLPSVVDFLAEYEAFDQVSLKWLLFGSNFLSARPADGILASYTRSEPYIHGTVKNFLHLAHANARTLPRLPHAHFFPLTSMELCVEVDKRVWEGKPWYRPPVPPLHYSNATAFLAHYQTQAYEVYVSRKVALPRDDIQKFRTPLSEAELHTQFNNVTNTDVAERYGLRVRAYLAEHANTSAAELLENEDPLLRYEAVLPSAQEPAEK